jgi:tetratricopeptide (TPR) repeat protein
MEDLSPEEVDRLNLCAWELCRTQPKRSRELAERAFAAAATYPKGRAESLLTQAWTHIHRANFDVAERLALEAIALLAGSEKRLLAKLSNLLGIVGGERGELAVALEHFLEAHHLFEACTDSSGAADALGNAALVYTYLGDYNQALELHLKTLALQEAIPNPDGIARTLSGLGLAYIEMGQAQEGLKHLLRSLELEATKAAPDCDNPQMDK